MALGWWMLLAGASYFGLGCLAVYFAVLTDPARWWCSYDKRLSGEPALVGIALGWPLVIPYQAVLFSARCGARRATLRERKDALDAEVAAMRAKAEKEVEREMAELRVLHQRRYEDAKNEIELMLDKHAALIPTVHTR